MHSNGLSLGFYPVVLTPKSDEAVKTTQANITSPQCLFV